MSSLRKIPDVELERYAFGELPKERARAVEADLSNEETARRLKEIKESETEILEKYPPHLMAVQIEARAEKGVSRSKGLFRILVPLTTVAAAAVLVWVLMPVTPPQDKPDIPPEVIILKGKPMLSVYRQNPDGPDELLEHNQKVKPGDILGMKYKAQGAPHGMIFSVDGRGSITLHYPSEAGGSTELEKEKPTALPFSYELDDAPGFEHFFFVVSGKPINTESVLNRAKELSQNDRGFLKIDGILEQHSILLPKDEQR